MILNEFKEKLFKRAEEIGFSECEIYYEGKENLEINVFKSEIDNYSLNKTLGVSFRGIYKGKMGYAYTEIMDEESIELLVSNAKGNAELTENHTDEIIFSGSDSYEQVKNHNEALKDVGAEEKIKLALQLEQEAYNYSDKVISTAYCALGTEEKVIRISNSKGLDLCHKSNGLFSVIMPVVKEQDNVNNAIAFKITNNIDEISVEELSKKAVDEALAYFGAKPVKSAQYRVLFKNSAAWELLQTFGGVFSGDNAQKGLSLLKEKEGTKVASEIVTLIDDPLMGESLNSSPFDAEGVATYKKNIIEEGKLNTLLHNLKTAKKAGIKSTGNASKASYSSTIEVAPSNLYIKPGAKDYEEMIKSLNNGIIITDMQGMHSGANPISGDFSLAAKGFVVEKGEITRPVEQITISGNFYDLMKNIELVGRDFELGIPRGSSSYGSPSIIVSELDIAGE